MQRHYNQIWMQELKEYKEQEFANSKNGLSLVKQQPLHELSKQMVQMGKHLHLDNKKLNSSLDVEYLILGTYYQILYH